MKLSLWLSVQIAFAICPCQKAKAHAGAAHHNHAESQTLSFVEENPDSEEPVIPVDAVVEGLTPRAAIKTNDALLRKAATNLSTLQRTGAIDLSQGEQAKSIRERAKNNRLSMQARIDELKKEKSDSDSRIETDAVDLLRKSGSTTSEIESTQ